MRMMAGNGTAEWVVDRTTEQTPADDVSAPLMSVVVPTCGRPKLARRCLLALLRQGLVPESFEIIVVDDGHGQVTRQLVAELAHDGQPRLRYLCQQPCRGPAAARNAGWRCARGPIIAFTEEDTVPEPDWLLEGWRALAEHPDWVAVAGRVVVPAQRRGQLPAAREWLSRGAEHADFATANAFVRRGVLMRVNGSEDRFRRTGHEDADLEFRLLALAGPVGRAPLATVLHPMQS